MAGSVNKVILIGNLGAAPEVRAMQSGDKVCNFNLATSESWKDKATGERKENTQWHRIVIFNQGLVSIAERFLQKGSKVWIEGQLETRKWTDRDNVERYTTEVVLRPFRGELTMLGGGPSDREKENPYTDVRKDIESKPAYYDKNNSLPPEGQTSTDYDDDIPF